MKGNIRNLAVFMIIAAVAMVLGVAMASADEHHWKNTIHGEYAVTGGINCLASPSGFTANLTPTDPTSAFSLLITSQGISTFEHKGKGRFETTGVLIAPPPSPQLPHANAFHWSFTFTYDVADDDTITITADANSYQVTFDTGPLAGVTFTADQYSLAGLVLADHKTLLLGSPTTLIQTLTFQLPTPLVLKMICNGSYVFTRLDQ